jgi:putative membrane-bound dehydrogenase-like protein
MKARLSILLLACAGSFADEFFPHVPPDMEIALFTREPLVRNPCALAFDAKGRLCVGMGPQYRNPKPNTPGDSVFILLDDDGDGRADARKEFATGFNSIQSLAWRGDTLWIANSPDLTAVRDLDGDDQADEYIRVYTDLGNLEHAIHGLNWGPDGKLYMSKGNSKGLTQPPHRIAPAQFRELWGVKTPGLPDFPKPVVFTRENYQRHYHDPNDDWGREGGVLRCDPDGANLEIVARGFRNPWDITFDHGFNWLGTDNDQTHGDKIFSPFYGAHFGWGHPWSFDWAGENHLPTVPPSGPLFEGSGAGIIFCGIERYPAKYRGIFLINDWLRREIYIYKPSWNGGRLVPDKIPFDLLAWAGTGRSMERSQGKKFDPVDIEIGPDEAIYISSWGREYGVQYNGGEIANEGRIYKLWPKAAPPRRTPHPTNLIEGLASHLPVWRVNAQEELIRLGATEELTRLIRRDDIPESLMTWATWTLGRMDTDEDFFSREAINSMRPLNLRIQCLRILAHRKSWPAELNQLLLAPEPRVRLETVLALRGNADPRNSTHLLDLIAREDDRIVSYAAWGALRNVLPESDRRALLAHPNAAVRRAAVLGLLEDDALEKRELTKLATDTNAATAELAKRRLDGKAETIIRGRPLPASPAPRSARRESVSDVLPLMAAASIDRGRELFFAREGSGCIACHRLEGIGNTFAPDLKDLGSRADAEFIIRSIIEPSAAITEGFTAHTVTTKDGEEFSGIIIEETGANVKLALANGETVSLPTSLIADRKSSRESAMPSNFGELLSAPQIADLAAFLRAPGGLRFELDDGQLALHFNGTPIGTYLFQHAELTRPAFVNIRTRSGIPVTREFPAPEAADHRWMHPGLALSFGWLDGHDYWRMKARVIHDTFLQEPFTTKNRVQWSVRNHYLSESGDQVVCLEDAAYELSSTSDGLLLQIHSQFYNESRDFYFGDQEESGLCIRMTPALSVKGGAGTILNERGETNEAGTWGKEFQWIDYSGLAENGTRAGLLIVPHPENSRPSWSHSRDYGVLVANPFPRQPKEQRDPRVKTRVPTSDRFHLRYSVLIYESK